MTSLPSFRVPDSSINHEDQAALGWVSTHIPHSSRFVLMRANSTIYEPVNDWFYPMTGSVNVLGPQGLEWKDNTFWEVTGRSSIVQSCSYDPNCLREALHAAGARADYVYLRRWQSSERSACCKTQIDEFLRMGFTVVYDGPGAIVLRSPEAGRSTAPGLPPASGQ